MIELMPYQPLEVDHQIGIVEPTTKLENIGVCLTRTINKMLKDKPIQLMAINTTENRSQSKGTHYLQPSR